MLTLPLLYALVSPRLLLIKPAAVLLLLLLNGLFDVDALKGFRKKEIIYLKFKMKNKDDRHN